MKTVLAAVAATQVVKANVHDHFMPNYLPNSTACPSGCAQWAAATTNATEQARLDATWSNNKAPANAANICAMPAASAGRDLGDGKYNNLVINSFGGPWCFCAKPAPGNPHEQYCYPNPHKLNVPEQINLQLAKEDVVVVSFVTREESTAYGVAKSSTQSTTDLPAPSAEFVQDSTTQSSTVPGVSHYYKALSVAEEQDYVLHFIKFAGLLPNTKYSYRVKSGSQQAPFSEWLHFRSPNVGIGQPTKLAIYGDMGHSHYNPMNNLQQDCASGDIDFIVHMGDHAYDLGLADDRRGDAYMNVFQPILSSCPWLPIIGNHESNDGDHFNRYLNMTWGEVDGKTGDAGGPVAAIKSTAESVLGELLTRATLLGSGIHAEVPSNTSRYFSIDIGLIHIAGLDLNRLDADQLTWLNADLAAVNRTKTPWIIVSSHFPLYHATVNANMEQYSAAYYIGEIPEGWATSGHDFKTVEEACAEQQHNKEATAEDSAEIDAKDPENACNPRTIGDMYRELSSALEPLLVKYNVDIYAAGHVHDYNSNWPICNSTICKDSQGNAIYNYDSSNGTVHITEGNGGVPGVVGASTLTTACNVTATPWCRSHGTGGAYGRIVAHDSHSLTYSHVQNNGGNVTDAITLTK